MSEPKHYSLAVLLPRTSKIQGILALLLLTKCAMLFHQQNYNIVLYSCMLYVLVVPFSFDVCQILQLTWKLSPQISVLHSCNL